MVSSKLYKFFFSSAPNNIVDLCRISGLFLLGVFLLLNGLTSLSSAQDRITAKEKYKVEMLAVVSVPLAQLRNGPGTQFQVVKEVAQGTSLPISGTSGNYYVVLTSGQAKLYIRNDQAKLSKVAEKGKGVVTHHQAKFDDRLIRYGVGNLFQLIEGAFGALLMVVAGIIAIIAASMGSYKVAISMLVVAVGAFILRALVSLFFGQDYPSSTQGELKPNSSIEQQQTQLIVVVKVPSTDLFSATNQNSEILRRAKQGTRLLVKKSVGAYYQVQLDQNNTGYVHKSAVKPLTANFPKNTSPQAESGGIARF